MSTIYDFKLVQPNSLWYDGIKDDGTHISYNAIITTIYSLIEDDDSKRVKIYINNEKLIEFSKVQVFDVNSKVKNRCWFCGMIYNKLNDPEAQYTSFYITFQHKYFIEIIIYEMLKYASMMNMRFKVDIE